MNIANLASRARTIVVAVGLAVVASIGATQAYAAEPKVDPAKAMNDAPAIIATAKIACDPAAAKIIGGTEYTKPDATKVKGQLYEIACKAGPGFIVTAVSTSEIYQPFTCILAEKVQKTNAKSLVCTLPENQPTFKWLQPVVQPYLPNCTVSGARLIGSTSAAPLIDRYEVGCSGQAGGIIDYTQLGQTAPTEYKSCLVLDGGNSACTLTTKEQVMATMTPLAAKADPKCQVNNVRFVGVSKENDNLYYEFGCSNQPGFIVATKTDNTFSRIVPCASAAGLGGCTFTDKGAAAAGANGVYTGVLKTAGITCTVSEYNVVGTQESSKRDYVEFKCPEQPWGLIGFVPQPGSTAGVNVTDCFLDQVRHKSCTMVTPDMLKAQLDKLIKTAEPKKNCDVADVRYIGESSGVEKGLIAELACKNKRGYIVVVSGDRTKLETDTPCRIAKAHNEEQQCQIAGNGTYTEAD